MCCAINRKGLDDNQNKVKGIEGEPSGYRATRTAKSMGPSQFGTRSLETYVRQTLQNLLRSPELGEPDSLDDRLLF
jgi:hypothetical protein